MCVDLRQELVFYFKSKFLQIKGELLWRVEGGMVRNKSDVKLLHILRPLRSKTKT